MSTTLGDERGSSAVEFVLVGTLLTVLTVLVLQIGVALYVRNIVHDAAMEGAQRAALADAAGDEAERVVRETAALSVGPGAVQSVSTRRTDRLGGPAVEVTVGATLPLIGVLGVPDAMEVTAYAPIESFDFDD